MFLKLAGVEVLDTLHLKGKPLLSMWSLSCLSEAQILYSVFLSL